VPGSPDVDIIPDQIAMSLRSRLPSQSVTFAALMILTAAASLMPSRWTGWVRGMVQVLGLPQWAMSATAHSIRDAVPLGGAPNLTADEARKLQEENAELRRLVGQQGEWLNDLTQRLETASRIRNVLGDADAEILIAPVLSYDASPRRDTLLIGLGSAAGVRRGQWVAAGVAAERRNPEETGQQTLGRQWLVGRVSDVFPRVSRVLLVSDPKFEEEFHEGVSVARELPDGRWQSTSANYLLKGHGRGRMVINQADADYVREGYGLVLARVSADLPVSLSLGKIVSSKPTNESALHFDLEVQPWADPQNLRQAYVIRVAE
jgi:cell shape-determining protein MreC